MKAVNSIPAYVERSTHFLAIVPTVQHRDLPEVVCDLGSWLGRGWCKCHQVDDIFESSHSAHSLTYSHQVGSSYSRFCSRATTRTRPS